MAKCPTCGKAFEDGVQRCPDDGTPLSDYAALKATAPIFSGPTSEAERPPIRLELDDGGLARDEALPPGMRIGEYEVTGKLGEGGMGTVYAGLQPVIGKRVAIKVLNSALSLDPIMVSRFIQEARSVNQIGHRNIVDIFSFGELPDRRLYFVMEHLQGKSLQKRIDEGPLEYADAFAILGQVCDALQAAHRENIIHRDLKPDNVFLAETRSGERIVKLLDFGIAKLIRSDGGGQRQTHTGQSLGTPLYMAPEQCLGRPIDPRTDIYALGVIMFELFTGRLPFEGDSHLETMNLQISEPPPRPGRLADLPASLEKLILLCMVKEPTGRPQSVADARQRLDEIAVELGATIAQHRTATHEAGGAATQVQSAPRRKEPARSRRAWALAGAAIAVAAGALALTQLKRAPSRAAVEPPLVDLQVLSEPPGGVVFIEGKKQALRTPSLFRVPRAPLLHVRVEAEGHRPFETTVSLVEEQSETSVMARLEPLALPGGRLVVRTNAAKASWSVDGKPAGERGGVLSLDGVAPGAHRVRVEAPGFEPREEALAVQSRELASFEWTLRSAPVRHTARPPRKTGTAQASDDVNAMSGWGH